MTLGELIKALEAEDPAKVLPDGFANPHCRRGDYYDLAFDPAQNVTVGSMLAAALSADGETYEGWKGGHYTMDLDSDCYLAEPRDLGETLGPTLLRLMLAAGSVPAPAAELTPEHAEAERCWSCDHLATDHEPDGCYRVVTCALVSVEMADSDALCSCAVSAESAASRPEQDAEQAGGDA